MINPLSECSNPEPTVINSLSKGINPVRAASKYLRSILMTIKMNQ